MDTTVQAVPNLDRTKQKRRTVTDQCYDLLHGRRGRRHFQELYFRRGRREEIQQSEKFDQHFIIKRNVIFERPKFNMRKQEPDEPVDAFITALYCLSEHCEFGTLRDELIRDRIVVGLQNVKLSEKLQMDSALTLQSAINSARQSESVKKQQETLRSRVPKQIDEVKGSKAHQDRRQNWPQRRPTTCMRCGVISEYHARQKCPAKDGTVPSVTKEVISPKFACRLQRKLA